MKTMKFMVNGEEVEVPMPHPVVMVLQGFWASFFSWSTIKYTFSWSSPLLIGWLMHLYHLPIWVCYAFAFTLVLITAVVASVQAMRQFRSKAHQMATVAKIVEAANKEMLKRGVIKQPDEAATNKMN